MRANCCCSLDNTSSRSSALACAMAASGLRISCAMPADTRPIAASFSCRSRNCTLRRSSRNTTQNSSGGKPSPSGARRRVKRALTCSVRERPSSNIRRTSRAESGQAPSSKARSTAACNGDQASSLCSGNGGTSVMPRGTNSARAAGLAARTRARRSTTSTPSVISSMTRRFSCACCRAISKLPRAAISSRTRPARELACQQRDHEHADAGQPGLREHDAAVSECRRRAPDAAQQDQRNDGRGAHRGHPGGHHAGHQHRQHQQRAEVQVGRGIEQVQRREHQHVEADRRHPLPAAQARHGRLRRRQPAAAAAATA